MKRFINKLNILCIVLLIMMLLKEQSYAAYDYVRFGLDGGVAAQEAGAMVELSAGILPGDYFGLGLCFEFAPHLGYRTAEKEANGDQGYLNYVTFGPQFNLVLAPSWPVNFSLLADAGIGGIGTTGKNTYTSEGQLNDLIFSVKCRASVNFLISDGFGFYIGGTYSRVYNSASRQYTDHELSGYGISIGLTAILYDASDY